MSFSPILNALSLLHNCLILVTVYLLFQKVVKISSNSGTVLNNLMGFGLEGGLVHTWVNYQINLDSKT